MLYIVKQIEELTAFFKNAEIPATVSLEKGSTIIDVPLFIQSHLGVLLANPGKPIMDVFYLRLLRVKELIEG